MPDDRNSPADRDAPAGPPANRAAWLTSKRGTFRTGPAPFPAPRPHEIVVRTRAVAVNPLDRMIATTGDLVFSWLRYPAVLGSDLSGEVVAVGSSVTRFRVGERVLAHAVGTERGRNSPAEGAFQQYVVVLERLTCPIPAAMDHEHAAVLPLATSTAASALFQTDYLGLQHPREDPEPSGRTLLVWGASTSVGSAAVQLAVNAGYEVVATASPHNHEHARGLGARRVLDYRSPTVVADLVEALRGSEVVGAIAVGTGSGEACVEVLRACRGNRSVALASPSIALDAAGTSRGRTLRLLRLLPRFAGSAIALQVRARRRGVRARFVWGSSLMDNEVCDVVYRDFLPRALADGRYRAVPEPLVVGAGLDQVPAALDTCARGVSARKVVISL